MSKKNNNDYQVRFKLLYDPYPEADSDMNHIYERYLQDENAVIRIDEKTYYRALQIFSYTIRESMILAVLDRRLDLKSGDTLVDDNGNKFIVKGCSFMSFHGEIPKWYFETPEVVLEGSEENIGHYFSKLRPQPP